MPLDRWKYETYIECAYEEKILSLPMIYCSTTFFPSPGSYFLFEQLSSDEPVCFRSRFARWKDTQILDRRRIMSSRIIVIWPQMWCTTTPGYRNGSTPNSAAHAACKWPQQMLLFTSVKLLQKSDFVGIQWVTKKVTSSGALTKRRTQWHWGQHSTLKHIRKADRELLLLFLSSSSAGFESKATYLINAGRWFQSKHVEHTIRQHPSATVHHQHEQQQLGISVSNNWSALIAHSAVTRSMKRPF